MSINAGSILWYLDANPKKLEKALNKAAKNVQKIGAMMTAAGAVITGALGAIVTSAANAGDAMQKMALRTGFSTEALSELKYAAEISGTSIDSLEKASKRLSMVIHDAGEETKAAAEKEKKSVAAIKKAHDTLVASHEAVSRSVAKQIDDAKKAGLSQQEMSAVVGEAHARLRESQERTKEKMAKLKAKMDEVTTSSGTNNKELKNLGVTYSELANLTPEEQFIKVASAVADLASASERAAMAQKMFGKSGTELLPMLAEGSAGLQQLRDRANELGLVWSQGAVNAAAAFNDALTTLKGAFAGVGKALAEMLFPILTKTIDKITSVVVRVKDWIASHDKLAATILKVVGGAGLVLSVLGPLTVAFGVLLAGAAPLITMLAGMSVPLLAVGAIIGGVVIAALVALAQNMGKIVEWTKSHWGQILDVTKAFKDAFIAFLKMIGAAGEVILKALGKALSGFADGWASDGERAADATRTMSENVLSDLRALFEGATARFTKITQGLKAFKENWSGLFWGIEFVTKSVVMIIKTQLWVLNKQIEAVVMIIKAQLWVLNKQIEAVVWALKKLKAAKDAVFGGGGAADAAAATAAQGQGQATSGGTQGGTAQARAGAAPSLNINISDGAIQINGTGANAADVADQVLARFTRLLSDRQIARGMVPIYG